MQLVAFAATTNTGDNIDVTGVPAPSKAFVGYLIGRCQQLWTDIRATGITLLMR